MESVLVVVVVRSGSDRWGVVVLPCWSQPAAVARCLAATTSRTRKAVSSRECCSGSSWADTVRCYWWSAFRLPANGSTLRSTWTNSITRDSFSLRRRTCNEQCLIANVTLSSVILCWNRRWIGDLLECLRIRLILWSSHSLVLNTPTN